VLHSKRQLRPKVLCERRPRRSPLASAVVPVVPAPAVGKGFVNHVQVEPTIQGRGVDKGLISMIVAVRSRPHPQQHTIATALQLPSNLGTICAAVTGQARGAKKSTSPFDRKPCFRELTKIVIHCLAQLCTIRRVNAVTRIEEQRLPYGPRAVERNAKVCDEPAPALSRCARFAHAVATGR